MAPALVRPCKTPSVPLDIYAHSYSHHSVISWGKGMSFGLWYGWYRTDWTTAFSPFNQEFNSIILTINWRTNSQPRVYIASHVNLCPQTDEGHTRKFSTIENNIFLTETCVPLELYFLCGYQASTCSPSPKHNNFHHRGGHKIPSSI